MRRPYTTYFPNQLADKLRKHRVIGHYALLFGADCCLFACGPTGVGGAARAALLGRAACGPTGVAAKPCGPSGAPHVGGGGGFAALEASCRRVAGVSDL